jgi:NAD(P)H dehydrogenase (quinone)
MNVFMVYWHPEEKSFNAAMRNTAVKTLTCLGHKVRLSDLRALNFDPVSDRRNFTTVQDPDYFKQQIEEMYATEANGFVPEIAAELEKLDWCDLMIWQFPLWWFGLPAVFKGWVDRVFAMGRTYGGEKIYETGVFRGKRALLSLTTGGPMEAYQKGGFNGDMLAILRTIQRGMLEFTGFSVLAPQIVYEPAHLENDQRRQRLEEWAARLEQIDSEAPIDVGIY